MDNIEGLTFFSLIAISYLLRRKYTGSNIGGLRKLRGFIRGFFEILLIPSSLVMIIFNTEDGQRVTGVILIITYGLGWMFYSLLSTKKSENKGHIDKSIFDKKAPKSAAVNMDFVKSVQKTPSPTPKTQGNSFGTIRFKYCDFEGDITERTVDIKSGKRGNKFKGYCHLRNEIRTFYFSRIDGFEIINVETGEIMTPMEWRNKLQGTKNSEEFLEGEAFKIKRAKKTAEDNKTWLKLTTPLPTVLFEGKRFALGGYFKTGNIDECKQKITENGGIVQPQPNGKTDYIVVNTEYGVNQTYENAIHGLHARDIEPVIISEEHWVAALRD